MPEPARFLDIDAPSTAAPRGDFADAMQQLSEEAEVGRPAAGASVSKSVRAEFLLVIGQMIRPLAVGMEDMGERLTRLIAHQATAAPDLAPVHAALDGLRGQLGRMGNIESANQKLFDALHMELRGYKDGFLFDSLQKPFIRDLIALQDDLSVLFWQIDARRSQAEGNAGETEFLATLAQNFDNARHGLLETFERMDVERQDSAPGEPVDKRNHRVISFEPAPDAAHDGCVARSLRPGFAWRGRPVRPEEIVAWRWTDPAPAPSPAPNPNP